jgi:hypothetical protein
MAWSILLPMEARSESRIPSRPVPKMSHHRGFSPPGPTRACNVAFILALRASNLPACTVRHNEHPRR